MNAKQLDKLVGKWVQVEWPANKLQGSFRIARRRPRSSIVETEAGQIFDGREFRLVAVFNGIKI